MTSCPRPDPYILRAFDSLRAAGFAQPVELFCEPGEYPLEHLKHAHVHENPRTLGCFQNWRHSLKWMVDCAEADWILMIQDDTIWRDDAARVLTAAINNPKLAEVGFLSPYTSRAMVHPGPAKQGWQKPKLTPYSFWGALALCLPLESARALLRYPRFRDHEHHRKVDVTVGHCFREMGKAMYVHLPSLANHIGDVSTLGRHKIKGIQWGRSGHMFRERA